jgi:hypothetical protein
VTLAISIGSWGGFYLHWGHTKRICIGWVALTWLPCDLDSLIYPTPLTSTPTTSPPSITTRSINSP